MENGSQKIGLRIAAGFLVAITIIVAVFASGITFPGFESNPSLGSEQGRLIVLLKDAPVEVDALWINMTELQVHKADGEGEWIPIVITDTFKLGEDYLEFDLLKYQNEKVLELADASVITGKYNKIRLTVTGAEAWSWDEGDEYPELDDDLNPLNEDDVTIEPLRVPPNRIDVKIDFVIDTTAAVIVTIDMQPDWIAISNSGNLRPVMNATVKYTEG